MISNIKDNTKTDPRWTESHTDESTFEPGHTMSIVPAVSPSKDSKGGKKFAKGPATVQKYKKAPDAPRRFKSAFIFFSIEKHRLIRESLHSGGQKEKTTNVAKMVSEAWKNLSPEERRIWEEKARKDRARYEVEVANYRGPWKVVAKRAKKPSDAPKRPMSAFLSFSNKRRMEAMRNNPDLSQAEISALLSKMWNEAAKEVRDKYVEIELAQRESYKRDIAAWREKDKVQKVKQRAEREATALKMAESSELDSLFASTADVASTSRPTLKHREPSGDMSPSEEFSFSRVLAQQPLQSSLSYSQNVACIARQQETLQQLSSVYLRQQETLQNLILANMATNLGRQQPSQAISLGNNLGIHNQGVQNQMNAAHLFTESRNLQQQQHAGVATSIDAGMNLTGYTHVDQHDLHHPQNHNEGGGGMDDWDDFAMGD